MDNLEEERLDARTRSLAERAPDHKNQTVEIANAANDLAPLIPMN